MSTSEEKYSSGDDDSHFSSSSPSPSQGDHQDEKEITLMQDVQSELSITKEIQSKTSDLIHKKALTIIGKINSCSDDSAKDPSDVYDSIEQETNDMISIWSEYFSQVEKKEKEKDDCRDDEKFRKVYMDMITEAFADELDDLRQGRVESKKVKGKKDSIQDNEVLKQHNVIMPVASEGQVLNDDDVKVLVSCLESGMEMWTEDEKQFLVNENMLKRANPHNAENNVSLHERRRRLLFGETS
mmetsp:Transcript_6426/g.9768  ORF Transcript_6426/g.9768 Transcript_6426/m.9768 type:complete len:241 (-) Transcript_6426:1043-1765(-)